MLLRNKDGKFDSSQNPFANGKADISEMVEDPNNPGAQIAKYRPANSIYGERIYESLSAGQAWEAPEEQSGHALSPVLSATARLTPFGTAFVRYAQTTRFPSINELTSSAIIDGAGTVGTLAQGASEPERNSNWEVGYAHDLTQFFPSLGFADARLSYYNTEIENFIDRGLYLDSIQFDQKKPAVWSCNRASTRAGCLAAWAPPTGWSRSSATRTTPQRWTPFTTASPPA